MYWILKTEKNTYSIEDLKKDQKTNWDGVRNYQARNNLKAMKKGDLAFIYHSVNDKKIVGIAEITKEHFPDKTAQEGDWVAVEVKFLTMVKEPISLAIIKETASLKDIPLVKQSRLSVSPLEKKEFDIILRLTKTSL